MEFNAKDVIAAIVIIGLFILVALDKITWQAAAPVISSIVFYYLGFKTGVFVSEKKTKRR